MKSTMPVSVEKTFMFDCHLNELLGEDIDDYDNLHVDVTFDLFIDVEVSGDSSHLKAALTDAKIDENSIEIRGWFGTFKNKSWSNKNHNKIVEYIKKWIYKNDDHIISTALRGYGEEA